MPCSYSYTLECNYNSGRQCNTLGAATLDDGRATPPHPGSPMPHRFSVQDYEQVWISVLYILRLMLEPLMGTL